jgi:hypothetical protein
MLPNSFGQIDMPFLLFRTPTRSVARPAGRQATRGVDRSGGQRPLLRHRRQPIEAFAPEMQDISSGLRFASVKIDPANLERVLSNRDGAFIVNRIRGALAYRPI